MRSMNSWFLRFYLLLHISLIGFAISDLPWKIDADMYSILKGVNKAEQKWSKSNSANFMILVGSENFDKARDAALSLYDEFAKDSSLQSFELFVDSNALQDLRNFFFKYRMRLQTEEFITDINKVPSMSLSKIYSANPLISLEHLDEDPFLLSENGMERVMNVGTWEIEEDLRVTEDNGINYILITGKLAPNVSAFADKENVISKIRKSTKAMEGQGLHIRSFRNSISCKRKFRKRKKRNRHYNRNIHICGYFAAAFCLSLRFSRACRNRHNPALRVVRRIGGSYYFWRNTYIRSCVWHKHNRA